jgi:hypothetical protein
VLASGRLSNEDLFNLKSLADHSEGSLSLLRMGGGELTSLVGVGKGTNFAKMGAGDDHRGGCLRPV